MNPLERLTAPGVPRCIPCQAAEAMGEQSAGARLVEMGSRIVALERKVRRLEGARSQHDEPEVDPEEVSLREQLAVALAAQKAAEADAAHLRFKVKQLEDQNAALRQRRAG